MAEKVLQTRIINKHTSYDIATNNETFIPKLGEIVLAKLDVQQIDGQTIPTFLMKVGDGEKSLKALNWLHAPASDVYAWAKQPTLAYDALPQTLREEIDTLQAAVGGDGSVAEVIAAAINALDVPESKDTDETNGGAIISAISETDGKISVTRRALVADDIPELAQSKITGLQDALDLKANASDVKDTTDAISARLDDSGDIKQAIDAAQSYAEGIYKVDGETKTGVLAQYMTSNDARVKAIEDDYTTAEQVSTIAQDKVDELANGQVKTNTEEIAANNAAIAALAGDGRTTETVKGNADAIADLEQRIGSVANVMNFRGVSKGATAGADITNPKAGDVIIYGEAEYVYDEAGNWVKFGDASDNLQAITELGSRVTNVEDSLKDSGSVGQKIIAAQTQADKGVADAATAQAKADANETAIGVINGSGDGSIAKALADAKAYADTAESDAVTSANTYTDGEIDKVEKSVGELTTVVSTNKTDIENNYARVKTTGSGESAVHELVVGQGDAEMVIIFDCGSVE